MRVTQKQIARKAGVSQTAVSMILGHRNEMSFSEEARRKVMQIARELGYSRRRHSTRNIGLIPPWHQSPEAYSQSTFYARFYGGAAAEARRHGYHIILEGQRHPDRIPDLVRESKIDGLICQAEYPREMLEQLRGLVPVVLLNREAPDAGLTTIMPDDRSGIMKAARHLYDNGHRRIAYLGQKLRNIHYQRRLEAYRQSLRRLGLTPQKDYTCLMAGGRKPFATGESPTAEVVDRLMSLRKRPTAVIGQNDAVLLPLMKIARERGWAIPEQLSVVGFDNETLGEYSEPPLSSVNQPLEEMGKIAVRELADQLTDERYTPRRIVFEVDLVTRQSVAPARL